MCSDGRLTCLASLSRILVPGGDGGNRSLNPCSDTSHGAQAGDRAEDSLRSLETAGAVPSPGKHGAGSVVGKAGMRQTTARLVIDYVTWRLLGGAETENGTGFIYRQVNVLP